MKYKIYSNGKVFKLPEAKLVGYGELCSASWDLEVGFPTLDGDILYVTRTINPDDDCPVIILSTESGAGCSAFYTSRANGSIAQSSHNWLGSWDLAGESGDVLRVYKFGEVEDLYDLSWIDGNSLGDESYCRKHGRLVAVLVLIFDGDDEGYWRLVDPCNLTHVGQTIKLTNMQDSLFVSNDFAYNCGEPGIYYVFDSGTEGVGWYYRNNKILGQSYAGWFGDSVGGCCKGDEIYIFHCGQGLYEYFDWAGSYFDDWGDREEAIAWLRSELGEPLIIRYNGSSWDLVQEGTRNDF